jgi:hypothetical protein
LTSSSWIVTATFGLGAANYETISELTQQELLGEGFIFFRNKKILWKKLAYLLLSWSQVPLLSF